MNGVYLVKDIAANVQKLNTFDVRDDDIYIISYPKSGMATCDYLKYSWLSVKSYYSPLFVSKHVSVVIITH